MRIPVDPYFAPPIQTPARYTNAVGTSREVSVIFDEEYQVTTVGDVAFQNASPVALCKQQQVYDARKGFTLDLHALLTDEEDEIIVDEAGNALLAEGVLNYKIQEVQPDAQGMTMLVLGKDL